MLTITFVIVFSLVVIGGLMIYLSIKKQWTTMLALAGIFSTLVTGSYAYYKIPIVTNTVQTMIGK